jgi:hypothetical protein
LSSEKFEQKIKGFDLEQLNSLKNEIGKMHESMKEGAGNPHLEMVQVSREPDEWEHSEEWKQIGDIGYKIDLIKEELDSR